MHLSQLRIPLLVLLLMVGWSGVATAQRSDLELLREAHFEDPADDPDVPYGLEPGRESLSPLYHLTSGGLWLWENLVAPDVCSPGGYSDSNTHYFKALTIEYGALGALFLAPDRILRNTRIGRVSTPKDRRGLIVDDPKRYRR